MPECRQQALHRQRRSIGSGELAADPDRQTEWWPDTMVFECIDGDFEQGCKVRSVGRAARGRCPTWRRPSRSRRMAPGKELHDPLPRQRHLHPRGPDRGPGRHLRRDARPATTPTSTRRTEPEMAVAGRRLFRRWVENALEKLRAAAEGAGSPPAAEWAIVDSNQGPRPYQRRALTN